MRFLLALRTSLAAAALLVVVAAPATANFTNGTRLLEAEKLVAEATAKAKHANGREVVAKSADILRSTLGVIANQLKHVRRSAFDKFRFTFT